MTDMTTVLMNIFSMSFLGSIISPRYFYVSPLPTGGNGSRLFYWHLSVLLSFLLKEGPIRKQHSFTFNGMF